MNAIRSRQPQQRPSVVQMRTSRRRNMNRLPTGLSIIHLKPYSWNSTTWWVWHNIVSSYDTIYPLNIRRRRPWRSNYLSCRQSVHISPPRSPHLDNRRSLLRMNNGNIRRLISPSNLRTRLRGQMSSRRFINSNTRNVQQRNSNRNNGVVISDLFYLIDGDPK
jgi:hypothetical protein